MPGGRCGHPTLVTPLPLVVGPLRRLALQEQRTLQEQSVQEVTRTSGSGRVQRGRIEKLLRALEEERNGVFNLGLGAESRGDLQVRCF